MASDSRSRGAGLLAVLTALGLVFLHVEAAEAKVFYSRQEALDLAFPDADRVEDETFVLRDDQVAQIESLARSAGLELQRRWFDAEKRFCSALLAPA